MRLPIITIPHPTLRKKSKPVTQVDKKVLEFIANLEETLQKKTNPQGVGLSAPQVDKLWRIFTTFLPRENPVIHTFINPVVVDVSKKLTLGPNEKEPYLEGCLSIPKIYGPVLRHQSIKIKFSIINYQLSITEKTSVFSGFPARVIQHELDHLDGILFTDRSIQQELPIYEEQRGKLVEIKLI